MGLYIGHGTPRGRAVECVMYNRTNMKWNTSGWLKRKSVTFERGDFIAASKCACVHGVVHHFVFRGRIESV